ncbi:MAG: aminotransferase class V-fold PLP-dependent enzyme, partial [Zoogloea sp.]|nr:aminotransferase class V-fold PLP-dependent enzyme [Zoogloea sp.]
MPAAIYLDNNATTRPAPEVVRAMCSSLETGWGNPSSPHAVGEAAKFALGRARAAVAAFAGVKPAEVVFTGSATEANQAALAGAVARPGAPRRLLLSAVEHGGARSEER